MTIHTKEHREKIRLALFGKKNPLWKGDKAHQKQIHKWIRKYWGKANHCENCSGEKAKRFEWANIRNHRYTRNQKDYKQLCKSCHEKMDNGKFCKRGHSTILKNLYIYPDGKRRCRICMEKYHRKYMKTYRFKKDE